MEQSPSLVEYGFRRAFITLIAIICTLLSVMDISIVIVAASDIRGNLGVSLDKVSGLITAYALAYIIIIPFSSWLSQQFGRRNYFLIAITLFTVCSLFCGNATGIRELIIFRFLQGLGGGAMLVLSHTIITESWPGKKRPTSQAFFMLGVIAGRILGGPVGGYLTDNFSWPYIFFVNIPAGIIVGLLILAVVRNTSYEKREDWLGTIMLTVGASSLYVILARGQHENWFHSPFIIILTLAGLTGLVLFIRRQTGLLRNVNLRTGLVLSFIAAFSWAVSSITLAFSPVWGLELPTVPLWINIRVAFFMLAVTAVLIERVRGLKYIIATGMLLFAIYSYMLFQVAAADMSSVYVFWLLLMAGMALPLLSVSVNTLALSKLEDKQIGQGAALYNITQQLGAALGIALFSFYSDHFLATKPMQYSPYLFLLFTGIICLLSIPFVLYAVKNKTHATDQL
jgi:DHA2 family multidrug resistance protein